MKDEAKVRSTSQNQLLQCFCRVCLARCGSVKVLPENQCTMLGF